MRLSLKTAADKVLESPGLKTLFSAVIPIAIGIASGTFVTEITINGVLEWRAFYKAYSFYALVLASVVTYFYYKALYLREVEVKQFLDDDYCLAYMRSKCLPEAAERYKELIRVGNVGELERAMEEFRRIMR